MKDLGIEWIGNIFEGWEMVRLKDIGKVIIGLMYSLDEVSEIGILVLCLLNI